MLTIRGFATFSLEENGFEPPCCIICSVDDIHYPIQAKWCKFLEDTKHNPIMVLDSDEDSRSDQESDSDSDYDNLHGGYNMGWTTVRGSLLLVACPVVLEVS